SRGRVSGKTVGEGRRQRDVLQVSCAPTCHKRLEGALNAFSIVWRGNDPSVRLVNQLRGGSRCGNSCQDRASGSQILEDLSRGNVKATFADIWKKQEQRIRLALQLEGALTWRIRQ